ncbi:MAG TPA: response regulator, partial [Polyangia bacterium]|nr:response regulator [Polyangia bacterium]
PDAVSGAAPGPRRGRGAAEIAAAEAARWQTGTVPESPSGAPPQVRDEAGADRARVLVVDDNPDVRAYVTDLLAPLYDVTIAVDGQAALEAVKVALPDIVLSDVMMPRLDGFGLLRALRADPATETLPVILLSARAGEESSIEGLDAGADDYLIKPFSARELVARVRTHVALQRRRRAWVSELERANQALDSFSYSVSHDLRAPLRAIDGFSRALAEDCADVLDARGRDHLARVSRGVARMSSLIEALLDLARLSRANVATDVVDLSSLASAVVADLRQAAPARDVVVEIADHLVAHGDRRLLNVVLVNLLGNAWKFTGRTPEARITVGREDGGERPFFVRDNGAGFDVSYAKRLFAPFQRFHGADEFEGTGIGLATVQRVIAKHGGRIWADAAPDRGATFYFTLGVASG